STSRPTALRRVGGLQLLPTGTPGGPVGTVGQVLVTGGAVSPDGTRVVLRTYTDAYLWRADDGDVARALTSGSPTRIPLPATRQGEAVTFSPDGRSLLTSTEGRPAAVHVVAPGDPAPPAPRPPPTPTGAPAAGGPGPRSTLVPPFGALGAALGVAVVLIGGGGKAAPPPRRG